MGQRISLLPKNNVKEKERSPYSGVPAKDEQGHSQVLGAQVAGYIKRQVEVLMKSGENRGWQTESDFLRWCFRLGLEKVAEEKRAGELHFSELHVMNKAMMEVVHAEEDYSNFDRVLTRTESLVQRLTAQGQIDRVKLLIYKVYHQAHEMQEIAWKKYYVKRLEECFGIHMKRLRISLKPSDQISDEVPNVYDRK